MPTNRHEELSRSGNPAPDQSRQLALQCAAAFAVLSIVWPLYSIRNEPLPWQMTAFAIGLVAFIVATITKQQWWWKLIHASFAPLAYEATLLSINPNLFLAAALAIYLVYRGAISGQVPLYLTNTATSEAIAEIAKNTSPLRLIDLGAGIGSVAHFLAKRRSDAQITGIENAPATWLIGYLRSLRLKNCRWRYQDLWQTNLAEFDIAYAFLSPAPMPELWKKIQREMRSDTLLISNSFPVPGVEPICIVEVADQRHTKLYCYQL